MEPHVVERWSRGRILAARAIAVVADAVQLGLFPLFAEGAASPLDAGLDLVVGVVLTGLLGWSWLFLPTFLAEAMPGLDLVPTWTAAVLIVTRKGNRSVPSQPEVRRLGGDGGTPRG